MSPFRGSDEALDREIAVVQGLVRVRLRRASAELRELETALTDLRRELRRRRVAVPDAVSPSVPAGATARS